MMRGFLYRPNFMILDTAMSHLDTQVGSLIKNRMKTHGISALIIEDRLQLIKDCDQILVLDEEGSLCQRGTHLELKDIDGIYQQLLKSESQHE